MPVENTTPNRNYPLPFRENELRDDVARIISAISGVDLDVANVLSSLALKSEDGHGHVISDVTGLAAAIAAKQDADQKGLANGFASLGSDGKVPTSQLPAAVLGALSYQGTWNANTNSPTIPAASASNRGWYYKVATPGGASIGGIDDWKVGDWIVSSGTTWDKVDNTESVVSVAGLDGVIGAAELLSAIGAFPSAEAGILAGHRNKIINGDFDVWQRGMAFHNPAEGSYTADRWFVAFDAAGTFTIAQNSGGAETLLGSPDYYLTWTQAVAATASYRVLGQRIEGARTLSNKRVTVTFTAFSDAPRTLSIWLRQDFGSGGSPIASLPSQSVNIDETPAKYSMTFDLASVNGKVFGAGNKLELLIGMPLDGTFSISLSRVSLVEGDATAEADPFSPRHIQQEWLLCRRYYETYEASYRWDAAASEVVYISHSMRVPKAVSPSVLPTYVAAVNVADHSILVTSHDTYEHRVTASSAAGAQSVIQFALDAEI